MTIIKRVVAALLTAGVVLAGASVAQASSTSHPPLVAPQAHVAQGGYYPSDAQMNSAVAYLEAHICGHHGNGVCYAVGIRGQGWIAGLGYFVTFNYEECNGASFGTCYLPTWYYVVSHPWSAYSYASGLTWDPSVRW